MELHTADRYGRVVGEEIRLLIRFGAHIEAHMPQICGRIADSTLEGVPGYREVPRQDLFDATVETMRAIVACWNEGRMPDSEDLSFDVEVVRRRARQGVNAGDWIAHGRVFVDVVTAEMLSFADAHDHAHGATTAAIIAMWGATAEHSQFAHDQFELAAAEIMREDEDRLRETLVALLRGGLTAERARAAAAAAGVDPGDLYCAVRIRPGTRELAHRLTRGEPTVGNRGVWVHVDGEVVGFTPPGRRLDIAECAGMGPPATLEALPSSYGVATTALEAAARFGRRGVHRIEDLGILPLVAADGAAADAVVERFVARVERSGDPGRALVETVDAYLRLGLQPGATAAALHLHPNSLRKRLARYEEVTGADLRNMDDLAAVWWALRRRELESGR